ncbi:MAG: stage V sporulation protein AD, partial [Clostridia bacterium]|nr:stage V sporulation protein AD [Clostridia bacterium]
MNKKTGRQTIILENRPRIIASAGVVGKKEGEGPLREEFDRIFTDGRMNEDSWEKAESAFQKTAIETAIEKSGRKNEEIDLLFAGDLLGQCIGTTFGIRDFGIPFAGLYGACSTMALSLAMAGVFVNSGAAKTAVAATSSHFCSAEKQFRLPLEYGGQRPPQAQWTATAAGAAVVENAEKGVAIEAVTFGKICDMGVTDANNMGAAMAPAAADTIAAHFRESGTKPTDYDVIVTGDLGAIGSKLAVELLKSEHGFDISGIHKDCGTMLFDIDAQDVNSGASGCGCSAAVVCTHFMRRLREGEIKKILFVGTGALMSTVSSQQGESIPTIAHAVVLKGG